MANDSFKVGKYKKAIDLYFAAEAFAPGQKGVVKDSVKSIFDSIELSWGNCPTDESLRTPAPINTT